MDYIFAFGKQYIREDIKRLFDSGFYCLTPSGKAMLNQFYNKDTDIKLIDLLKK